MHIISIWLLDSYSCDRGIWTIQKLWQTVAFKDSSAKYLQIPKTKKPFIIELNTHFHIFSSVTCIEGGTSNWLENKQLCDLDFLNYCYFFFSY